MDEGIYITIYYQLFSNDGVFLLLITIAEFAVDEFNTSASTAGLASSIFIIGSLVGRLVAGRYIERLGSRKMLLYGLIGFLITSLLYFFALNITLLLLYRLLQGITVGIVSTATGTIVAKTVPAYRLGEGIGYFSLSAILSTAIGPYIGLLLLENFQSFDIIFLFNSLLAAFVLCIFFFIKFPPYIHKPLQKEGSLFASFIEPKALSIAVVALFAGVSYSGILAFMTFYTNKINLAAAGGLFFLIYAVVVVLTRPLTGKLLDARGANIIIYPCLLLYALGMYLFSTTTTSLMFVIAAICIGVGYGNFTSVAQALAVKKTTPERMGLATSTFFIFMEFGLGFGPYVLGLLVPTIGYRAIFSSMAIVILAALVLYYVLHARQEASMKCLYGSDWLEEKQ